MGKGCVIVTGGSRGIGLAIARQLAAEGYDLALTDIDETGVRAAADQLAGATQVRGYGEDVSPWGSVSSVIESIQGDFERIWGLVNNAGVTRDGLFVRMSPENWQFVLDVNLTGTYNFTRAVAPILMRQREGRIVSIASVIGLSGNAGQANYAASKAGVIALTKSVARELGGRSITVNAVAPGFIATDMTAKLDDRVKHEMLKSIALKRFGEGKDIAAVVAFLLSEGASYITGQTLVCDGGMVY